MTSLAEARSPARSREDSEAERLYGEYSERLLAYCLRRLGSRSEAEDAVQCTFLYALRALRRGVVPECESAWLHTIARNVCRWQQRTASRRPLDGDRGLELVASPERDENNELLADLKDALASLPERQRHALLLREWRGLSAHEIGEHLELSAPATHALLTRARHTLAQKLTAPRRTALGLAATVYELRSWLKAALGGASAKAAVATIAVVGAGAGAVATERSFAGDEPAPAPLSVSVERVGGAPSQGTPTSRTPAARGSSVVERSQPARGAQETPEGVTALSALRTGRERPFVTSLPPRGFDRPQEVPVPTQPGAPPAPTPQAPAPPSLELPAPPKGDLPPVEVPPVDLPPVDPPPVDVPPVDLPPLDLPTDVVPPIDLPPVDLPPVDVPSVDLPPLPPQPLPLP